MQIKKNYGKNTIVLFLNKEYKCIIKMIKKNLNCLFYFGRLILISWNSIKINNLL